MASKRVTIAQVAETVGVSPMAVSCTLNNTGRISARRRREIRAVARRMGYEPNLVARGLRQQKTQSVAVIAAGLSMVSNLEAACRVLRKRGYRVLLLNSERRPDLEYEAIRQAAMWQVDGVLLFPARDDATAGHLDELRRRGIRTVTMSRPIEGVPCDVIRGADEQSGYAMTRRLLDLGHRTVAFIAFTSPSHTDHYRDAGWQRAMQEAGMPPALRFKAEIMGGIETGETDIDGAADRIESWLDAAAPPTAVVTSTPALAAGVYRAAWRRGLRIGRDLSVASYLGSGSQDLQHYLSPPLSGMVCGEGTGDVGRVAAERLVSIIEAPDDWPEAARCVEIPGRWIDGGSVGPPPAQDRDNQEAADDPTRAHDRGAEP
jgi:LacI family transcriptional regulator